MNARNLTARALIAATAGATFAPMTAADFETFAGAPEGSLIAEIKIATDDEGELTFAVIEAPDGLLEFTAFTDAFEIIGYHLQAVAAG